MRFFNDFPEAINELRRELKEMGIRIHTKSVQNKNIEGKADFDTLELQNYTYTVLHPNADQVPLKNEAWADAEIAERLICMKDGLHNDFMFGVNPGEAYKLRGEYWNQFINKDGEFDYSYSERYAASLDNVITALEKDRLTRRAFLPVFSAGEDFQDDFSKRIPCTIGYWFNYRNEKLNITYLLRSSDFGEHFNYDIWLTSKLLEFVAGKIHVPVGTFTHWIGSFHVFEKDVSEVF